MVAAWGVGLFVAGLALVAVELAYPRRYVGVIGFDLSVLGLMVMFLPASMDPGIRVALLFASTVVATAIAIPFYRRFAPHVGPMQAPDVVAGDFGEVVEPITRTREGLVRAGGILWSARADEDIMPKTRVRILVIEADRLWVETDLEPAPDERQPDENDADQRD